MAFETTGIDDLISKLDHMGELTDEISEDLLFSSGDILVKHIKENMVRAGHVRTSSMLNNVKFKRKIKRLDDGQRVITVMSMKKAGQSKKQRLNAYKAFWANYGTSKQAGTRFWDKGVMEAQPEIEAEQMKITKEYMQKKGIE